MRFSKLKINGFKGFADPVELPIRDGLSGIVGPNGCGKSNLVEAIGWVMGENRPTAMRGGAMEDVIFSGSATRPAGALAEVELIIDNQDRSAPFSFNDDDELAVSRRIEREHGSSFRANGRDVRWRDLQLLFADSASGARSSALVSQGRTNEIINSKPAARKGILEEAAGIGGLHHRRHEAELKLSATEQNLARTSDVLEQLRSQVASLNRQARQARRYRKLGEQLRTAEFLLLYLVWRRAAGEAAESQASQVHRTDETKRLQREANRASLQRSELEERLEPLRTEAAAFDAALQRMRAESEHIEIQETNARQAAAALRGQIAELSEGIDREAGLRTDACDRIERLDELRATLLRQGEGHEERFEDASCRLSESADALAALERELDLSNRRIAEIQSARDAAERSWDSAKRTLALCREREKSAASRVAAGEARLAEATISVKSADGARSDAERYADDAEIHVERSESARASALTGLTESKRRLSEADSRLGALRSEQTELCKLVREDTEDEARLLNHVKVAPGYEAAFGAALGDDIFAPLGKNGTAKGWRELEPYEEQRALPDSVEPLAAFVQAPPLLRRRLSQTGLAQSDDIARLQPRLLPGQRLVTTDGELCRWDGFVFSGEESPEPAALRLRQLNRLKALTAEMTATEKEAERLRGLCGQLAAKFSALDKADKEARTSRLRADEALSAASRDLSRAEADSSIAEMTLDSLRGDRSRASEETRTAEAAFLEAEAAVAGLEDPASARLVAAGLRQSVGAARENTLEARSAKASLEREQSDRVARLAGAADELETWRARMEQAGRRIADLTGRRDRLEEERPVVEEAPGRIAVRKQALASEISAAEERCRRAADALRVIDNETREAAKAAAEADRRAARSLELKGRADADAAHSAERLLEAVGRISEKTGSSPDELAERLKLNTSSLPEPELQEIEVNRLRRSRDSLGAVNLMAEQDIIELQTEIDELDGERADLEKAVAKLRRTISGLNREGRERLLTAFEAVNENFKDLFTQLFGGGKARLELVEGDDPLDTGLEILCHPPGKRFSTISLLSGGEQTLTAVALIFAFFLANPAPVCVLDEVDAPLDDSNVSKFCELMGTIVRRTETRFLVITHNPITMAYMDRLYGITMQEKGVSRLVSVDLGEAEKLAA